MSKNAAKSVWAPAEVLSIRALCGLAGISSANAYQRIRRGKLPFTEREMEKIARVLVARGVWLEAPPSGSGPTVSVTDVQDQVIAIAREITAAIGDDGDAISKAARMGASKLAGAIERWLSTFSEQQGLMDGSAAQVAANGLLGGVGDHSQQEK